jgi:hypothetical protein
VYNIQCYWVFRLCPLSGRRTKSENPVALNNFFLTRTSIYWSNILTWKVSRSHNFYQQQSCYYVWTITCSISGWAFHPLQVILFNNNISTVRVTLRLTVSQSVCFGFEPRLGLMTGYSFLIEKLQSCPYGAPSLTRGRVCHLSVIAGSISPLSSVQLFTVLLLKPNHIYNIYKASVSPGSVQQTIQQSVLRIRIGILLYEYLVVRLQWGTSLCPKCLVTRHRGVRHFGTTLAMEGTTIKVFPITNVTDFFFTTNRSKFLILNPYIGHTATLDFLFNRRKQTSRIECPSTPTHESPSNLELTNQQILESSWPAHMHNEQTNHSIFRVSLTKCNHIHNLRLSITTWSPHTRPDESFSPRSVSTVEIHNAEQL